MAIRMDPTTVAATVRLLVQWLEATYTGAQMALQIELVGRSALRHAQRLLPKHLARPAVCGATTLVRHQSHVPASLPAVEINLSTEAVACCAQETNPPVTKTPAAPNLTCCNSSLGGGVPPHQNAAYAKVTVTLMLTAVLDCIAFNEAWISAQCHNVLVVIQEMLLVWTTAPRPSTSD